MHAPYYFIIHIHNTFSNRKPQPTFLYLFQMKLISSIKSLKICGIAFSLIPISVSNFGVPLPKKRHIQYASYCFVGILITTSVPCPTTLFISMLPPFLSKISFAIDSPNPVPPISLVRALSTR